MKSKKTVENLVLKATFNPPVCILNFETFKSLVKPVKQNSDNPKYLDSVIKKTTTQQQ